METLDWLEINWRMRDNWKCVLKGDGELYLMMDGQALILKLYVDNSDTVHRVYTIVFVRVFHYSFKEKFMVVIFSAEAINTNFASAIRQRILDEVECDGTEPKLLDCRYHVITEDSHFNAISFKCQMCKCRQY